MIDTVNFRIPIDEADYEKLGEHSKIHIGYDNFTKEVSYKIIKIPIRVGSFTSDRIIRIPRQFLAGYDNYAELELSIPKYLFGHNVRMITVSQFNEACALLQKELKEKLDFDADRSTWLIQKIDFCFNWKLGSKDELNTYTKIFQNLEYSRKKPHIYKTSVLHTGSAYSVEFYSKYDEYVANSFNELRKTKPAIAYEALELSENVLRFELKLKKPQFKTVFRKDLVHISDITESIIIKTLNLYLKKYIKVTNTKITSNDQVSNILKKKYGDVVGRGLYEKYRLWLSTDPTDKETFKSYSYPNKYKFFQALNKAELPLVGDKDFTFALTIPSENAVF